MRELLQLHSEQPRGPPLESERCLASSDTFT